MDLRRAGVYRSAIGRTVAHLLVGSLVLASPSARGQIPSPEPGQPTPTGTATTSLGPPFGRDDVPALEARLERARARFEAALEAWQAAGRPSDGPTRDALRADEAEVGDLEATIETARDAPVRALLELRLRYDKALKRIAVGYGRVRLERASEQAETPGGVGASSGPLVMALAVAEQELEALERARETAQSQPSLPELLDDKLSDLERIDDQLRQEEERIAFIERVQNHLEEGVFARYVAFEDEVAQTLDAYGELERLWPELRGTPGARYGGPAPTPAEVARIWFTDGPEAKQPDLRTLWAWLSGAEPYPGPFGVQRHAGRLAELQLEVEQRKFLRDRLLADAERLRLLEVQKAKAPTETEARIPVVGNSEYTRLGERIAAAKLRLEELANESSKLEASSTEVMAELEERRRAARKLERSVAARTERLGEVAEGPELLFPTRRGPVRGRGTRISAFVAGERLAAEEKRLAAAEQAVRRVEIRKDVLERRRAAFREERARIEDVQLPRLRTAYYQALAETMGIRGLRILIVIAVALLVVRLIRRGSGRFIERLLAESELPDGREAIRRQRTRTLVSVLAGALRFLVYLLALFFVIGQLDIDYGPLLVAAGGLSLAVGFGAQSLVRDFFTGFFILLEGQFSIGDVVQIDGRAGLVEDLNLRTTVLRSLSGEVHTIPNGEIKVTTNLTKQWSRSVLDIGVAYEENVDDVTAVLQRVGRELRSDEAWGPKIRNFDVLGLESLGDSSVVVRVLVETRPGDQWSTGREFRRRVKMAFDELGIEIPWPQRVVTQKSPSRDAAVASRKRRAIRRYIGEEVEGGTGSFNVQSVEERDRAGILAQKEASIREEHGAAPAKPPPAEPRSAEPPPAEHRPAEPRPAEPPPAQTPPPPDAADDDDDEQR